MRTSIRPTPARLCVGVLIPLVLFVIAAATDNDYARILLILGASSALVAGVDNIFIDTGPAIPQALPGWVDETDPADRVEVWHLGIFGTEIIAAISGVMCYILLGNLSAANVSGVASNPPPVIQLTLGEFAVIMLVAGLVAHVLARGTERRFTNAKVRSLGKLSLTDRARAEHELTVHPAIHVGITDPLGHHPASGGLHQLITRWRGAHSTGETRSRATVRPNRYAADESGDLTGVYDESPTSDQARPTTNRPSSVS